MIRRSAPAVAAAAVCALLGTGCGSDETLAIIHLGTGQPGSAASEPGLIVLRFTQAARRGDAGQMWALLSESTHRSLGPGEGSFAHGTAPDLTDSFADFRQGQVLLSRALDREWAVGAVTGRFEDDEGNSEPAAYALALRREGGRWRIELAGLAMARLRPEPGGSAEDRPEVRAEAQAGDEVERMLLWVDGEAASVPYERTSPFTGEIDGRLNRRLAGGEHAVVVFAQTRVTAAALAWTFEVGD